MDMCLGSAQGVWPVGYSHIAGFVVDSAAYQYLLLTYNRQTGECAVAGAMIPPTAEDEVPQWAFDALHSWVDPTCYSHVVGIYHPFSPMDICGAKHGGYVLFYSHVTGIYRLMLVHPGGRLNLCRAGTFAEKWTLIVPFDQAASPHPVVLLYEGATGRYEIVHIPTMKTLSAGYMQPGWTDIVPKKPAPHRWVVDDDGAADARGKVSLSRPGSRATREVQQTSPRGKKGAAQGEGGKSSSKASPPKKATKKKRAKKKGTSASPHASPPASPRAQDVDNEASPIGHGDAPSSPPRARASRNRFFCYNNATGQCAFEVIRNIPASPEDAVASPDAAGDAAPVRTSEPTTHSRRRPGCRLVAMDCGAKSCCVLYRHTMLDVAPSLGAATVGSPVRMQSAHDATPRSPLIATPLLPQKSSSSMMYATPPTLKRKTSSGLQKRLSWEMDVHGPLPEAGAAAEGKDLQVAGIERTTSFATPLSRSLSGSMLTRIRAEGAEMLLTRSIGVNREAWSTIVALPPLPAVQAVHARHLMCYSTASGQWWICTMTARVTVPTSLRRPSPPRVSRTLLSPGGDVVGASGVEWPGARHPGPPVSGGCGRSDALVPVVSGELNSTGDTTLVSAVSSGADSRATAQAAAPPQSDRLTRKDWARPWTHSRWERTGSARLQAQLRRDLQRELEVLGWARDSTGGAPSPPPHPTSPLSDSALKPVLRSPEQSALRSGRPAGDGKPAAHPQFAPEPLEHASDSPSWRAPAEDEITHGDDDERTVLVAEPAWDRLTVEGVLEEMNLQPFYQSTGYAAAALRGLRCGKRPASGEVDQREAETPAAAAAPGTPRSRWAIREMNTADAAQAYSPRPPGVARPPSLSPGEVVLPAHLALTCRPAAAADEDGEGGTDPEDEEAAARRAEWEALSRDEQEEIALGLLRDDGTRAEWRPYFAGRKTTTGKAAALEARVQKNLTKARQAAAPPTDARMEVLAAAVDRVGHQKHAIAQLDLARAKMMVPTHPKHTAATQKESVVRMYAEHARVEQKKQRTRDAFDVPVKQKVSPRKLEAACEALYERQVDRKTHAVERAREKYLRNEPAPPATKMSRGEVERSGRRMYADAMKSKKGIAERREMILSGSLSPTVLRTQSQIREAAARLYANEPRPT
eukprot:TRINITY_DN6286_c0_g1_i1.p1 TRINITY_DN6286_c0_g1~~TRINITY_DN6286_c0_g1_i1.p1  ORF type:complete len:1147 (+),score=211.42 TRINITY_DN6286_c0_g1_i1:68-3508(+)